MLLPTNIKINIDINEVLNSIVLLALIKAVADDWIGGIVRWIGKMVGLVLKLLGKVALKLLRRMFISTEADLIIFLHSFRKAARNGHQYKTISSCMDGQCKKIS